MSVIPFKPNRLWAVLLGFLSLVLPAQAREKVGASGDTSALGFLEVARHQETPQPVLADSITPLADEASDPFPTAADTLQIDSIGTPVDTARLRFVTDSLAALAEKSSLPKPQFIPNPNRALWLSLVLPGAGQIYNRKYWKLPIIYGGFLGCAYALMWNQQMYKDYSQAYLDIMDDDPNTASYKEMLPPRYDITGREEQFKNLFKRKKDYYRRYRDLSAFCFVGVYLLSVIDAYVDAQLSEFDITPDLSMRVAPAVLSQPSSLGSSPSRAAYGVGCSLNF